MSQTTHMLFGIHTYNNSLAICVTTLCSSLIKFIIEDPIGLTVFSLHFSLLILFSMCILFAMQRHCGGMKLTGSFLLFARLKGTPYQEWDYRINCKYIFSTSFHQDDSTLVHLTTKLTVHPHLYKCIHIILK